MRIIRAAPGELPVMDEEKRNRCIACGQCMAFCPTRACAAPGLSLEDSRALRPELYPDPEQVRELLFARRSIRNFQNRPVSRETFEAIVDAARFAPTSNNIQDVRWVIFESREKTRALLGVIVDWLRELPEGDPDLAGRLHASGVARAWDKGVDAISRDAPHAVFALADRKMLFGLDGAIQLSYFEIAAQAYGVGCCWNGYLIRALVHPMGGTVREFLGIREGETGSALFAGLPRFRAVSRPPRHPARVSWV